MLIQRIRHWLKSLSHYQLAEALLIACITFAILYSLGTLTRLAIKQYQNPVLAGDSWTFAFTNTDNALQFLLTQHNEHRLVWARLAALAEVEYLKIPATSTALFQNLFLIVAGIIILLFICRNMLGRPKTQIICWLSCSLVLVNPWQAENLSWEFQVPWFFINAIVLLNTYYLSKIENEKRTRLAFIYAATIPWISIFATGQGIAASLSLCLALALISKRLSIPAITSTATALFFYFKVIGYTKPSYHPTIQFDFDYFLTLLAGGAWQGLGLAMAVILACLTNQRFTATGKQAYLTLKGGPFIAMAYPGLFSLSFMLMTTLSRSGLGIEQARSGRYVTHSLLLLISVILIASALVELACDNTEEADFSSAPANLLIPLLTILATLISMPQVFTKQAPTFFEAWKSVSDIHKQRRRSMQCNALHNSLVARGVAVSQPCEPSLYPDATLPIQYFSGQLASKPIGWHKKLANESVTLAATGESLFQYNIEALLINTKTIEIRGWAFDKQKPVRQAFLTASYANGSSIAFPIDQLRPDVKAQYSTAEERSGFAVAIPRKNLYSNISRLSLSSSSGTEIILTKPKLSANP